MAGTVLGPVLLGPDRADTRHLAELIGATLMPTPEALEDHAWEAWRDSLAAAARADAVIVALPSEPPAPVAAATLDLATWSARAEEPLVRWTFALGAAALLCADHGTILALVDGPPPLDSAGLGPEAAVAEAVEALARSLALSEGSRGVRANCVVTPCRLVPGPIIAPTPPLPGFPGTWDEDVAGTLRLLLSPDAAWLSGRMLAADRGRSW